MKEWGHLGRCPSLFTICSWLILGINFGFQKKQNKTGLPHVVFENLEAIFVFFYKIEAATQEWGYHTLFVEELMN